MTKKIQALLDQYYAKLKILRAFNSAQALLSWDREAIMPQGASNDRGETISVLAGFSHELAIDKTFVELVDQLVAEKKSLSSIEVRSVTQTQRELKKTVTLSSAFVEETNEIVTASYTSWLEAKQTNNFKLFEPHLEKVIENRKEYAHFLNPTAHPYDVLLDDYEENLTVKLLEPVFKDLRKGLKELLPQVLEKQQRAENPLNGIYLDRVKLENFLKEMVQIIGFDMSRGGFGHVEHPFEISISANDNRINTHYDVSENSFTVMGMIHELGHGLYEQNGDPKYIEAGLDGGTSLGIHESQSRFLENVIGRSQPFWTFFLPKLKLYFPELKDVSISEVVKALNTVQPSLIRTEADEITYNLHILLRFELEVALVTDQLKVSDLPEAWRAGMKDLLGIEPPDDKTGVLQDVHWAWGNIGYFPTYTLGNLNAAQLLKSFEVAHPSWEVEVQVGNFTSYFNWFKENVWQHSSMLTPLEIMKNATGQTTQSEFLLEYLKKKYLQN